MKKQLNKTAVIKQEATFIPLVIGAVSSIIGIIGQGFTLFKGATSPWNEAPGAMREMWVQKLIDDAVKQGARDTDQVMNYVYGSLQAAGIFKGNENYNFIEANKDWIPGRINSAIANAKLTDTTAAATTKNNILIYVGIGIAVIITIIIIYKLI